MDTKEVGKEFLEHHGVKGMRWGVRKKRDESARAKSFGKGRKGKKKKAVDDPLKDIDDQELRAIVSRMSLEKQYRDLNKGSGKKSKNAGAEFAKSIAVNIARTQITNAANAEIAKILASRK